MHKPVQRTTRILAEWTGKGKHGKEKETKVCHVISRDDAWNLELQEMRVCSANYGVKLHMTSQSQCPTYLHRAGTTKDPHAICHFSQKSLFRRGINGLELIILKLVFQ